MDLKNHFFLTLVALLGLVILAIKPGHAFLHNGQECKFNKGKRVCPQAVDEYKMNHPTQVVTLVIGNS